MKQSGSLRVSRPFQKAGAMMSYGGAPAPSEPNRAKDCACAHELETRRCVNLAASACKSGEEQRSVVPDQLRQISFASDAAAQPGISSLHCS